MAMPTDSAAPLTSRPVMLLALVTVPFGLGYFLSYLFRTVNAIIAPQLTAELSLTAGDLGLLTSLYFIVFAAFQLPLGIILDRYGPRRVQLFLLFIAALGAALFAVGRDFSVLALGRSLIGLGVSGCLMAAIQGNVLWWPRDRLPMVNGITGAFGSVGALVSTVPVEMMVQIVGWRGVFLILAVLTVLTALLIWVAVPRREAAQLDRPGRGWRGEVADLKAIYMSGFFWRVSILILVHAAAFLSYQSLWTAAWLRDVAGLDRIGVANGLLLFNVGMLTGALLIGFIADRLQSVGIKPVVSLGVCIASSIITQCLFAVGLTSVPALLCFAFGFFGSSMILVYAVLGQHFPTQVIGRVNTAQNMLIFMSAFAAQWGIGEIIDLWPPVGEGRFHPDAQQAAMIVMIGLQCLGFLWFAWPRRKA